MIWWFSIINTKYFQNTLVFILEFFSFSSIKNSQKFSILHKTLLFPCHNETHFLFSFLQGSPKALRAQNGSSCRALITFGKGSSSCRWTAGPDVRSFCVAPVSSSPQSKRAKRGKCTSCRSSEERYARVKQHSVFFIRCHFFISEELCFT